VGLASIKLFNSNLWIKLLKYSIGSRMIHSIPKGLKQTYDFVTILEKRDIQITKEEGLLRFKYPIERKFFNFLIAQDASDASVFTQIIINQEYSFLIDILNKKGIQPRTMIDAGANIGLTSVYFKAFYPDIEIIALEPAEGTFQRLTQNIQRNNFSKVSLLQKGIWNTCTRLKEDRTFRDGQDWSFRLVEAYENEDALIETTTIPQILEEYQFNKIDLLKIDIEGGEKEVFAETADLNWLKKVRVIAIEIHDEFDCRTQIENTLVDAGFELSHSGELTIGINSVLCNQ
jgi:FkbM family methyltransferase